MPWFFFSFFLFSFSHTSKGDTFFVMNTRNRTSAKIGKGQSVSLVSQNPYWLSILYGCTAT
jgi:hypothetical protein